MPMCWSAGNRRDGLTAGRWQNGVGSMARHHSPFLIRHSDFILTSVVGPDIQRFYIVYIRSVATKSS